MMRTTLTAFALFASTAAFAGPPSDTAADAISGHATSAVSEHAPDALRNHHSELTPEERERVRQHIRGETADRAQGAHADYVTSSNHQRFADEARANAWNQRPEAAIGRDEDVTPEQRAQMKERAQQHSVDQAQSHRRDHRKGQVKGAARSHTEAKVRGRAGR